MCKLSDVIFEQRPLVMNEKVTVKQACAAMRDGGAERQDPGRGLPRPSTRKHPTTIGRVML
jgi:hypothetical protein